MIFNWTLVGISTLNFETIQFFFNKLIDDSSPEQHKLPCHGVKQKLRLLQPHLIYCFSIVELNRMVGECGQYAPKIDSYSHSCWRIFIFGLFFIFTIVFCENDSMKLNQYAVYV